MMLLFFFAKSFLKTIASRPFQVQRGGRETAAAPSAGGVGGAEAEYQGEEEDLALQPKKMTDKEKIYRLAQSDPDRAADLVRRWLREEA